MPEFESGDLVIFDSPHGRVKVIVMHPVPERPYKLYAMVTQIGHEWYDHGDVVEARPKDLLPRNIWGSTDA